MIYIVNLGINRKQNSRRIEIKLDFYFY